MASSPLQLLVLPDTHELQRGEDSRWRWINYSAFDAKATWDLHSKLKAQLQEMPAEMDDHVRADYRKVRVRLVWLLVWLFVCALRRRCGCVRLLAPALLTRAPCPPLLSPTFLQAGIELESMWDVYRRTWLPFGGLLTDMEAIGMAVDRRAAAAATSAFPAARSMT